MPGQLSTRSDLTETMAIHVGLKTALRARQFDKLAAVKSTAEALCKELQSERSVYGKQLKMIDLMERGVKLEELGRKLHCSRRTVFRYLNNLEAVGLSIRLESGKYFIDKAVLRMLRV